MRSIRPLAVLLGALLCVAVTVGLFARAYPMVDAGLSLDRAGAVARARSLAAASGFAPATGTDAAALFEGEDSLTTYVDFAAGGPDSVRALARSRDLPLYRWVVRLYRPGDVRETNVAFAPDGRTVGLARRIPEDEARPTVTDTAGRRAADEALARWGSQQPAQWRLVGRSVVTQPRSGRVDRTYRYERVGRRIGAAPLRADVTVTGAATPEVIRGGAHTFAGVAAQPLLAAPTPGGAEPLTVHVYADLPDAWARRYGEMRASNDTLATFPLLPLAAFALAAIGALVHYGRAGLVRWRPAAMIGGTVGLLMAAAGVNELPIAWFGYDTATAPLTFVVTRAIGALATGALAGLWVTVAVAAAEVCARRAFPAHYDWFAYPRFAGAPAIARRVLGGYALAAFGFAYVTVFYVTMRGAFGWWVPTGTLDDPNQIATPAPWVSAAGTAMFAGTWEEAIFRGVPLALLAFWAQRRYAADPGRRAVVLGAGVILTALTFGFGHANYPSWPAYSRGVELFLEAVLWAVLALRVGLPTTMIAHTLYDLTWFGLFALHGRGAAYRATGAAVLIAFAIPALVVAANWWQRRRALAAGLTPAAPPRFADVTAALAVAGDATVIPAEAGIDSSLAPARVVRGEDRWTPASAGATEHDGRTPADLREHVGGGTATGPTSIVPVDARVGPRTRTAAAVVIALAAVVALFAPSSAPLGPPFTASRARVAFAADSALRARGVDPARWDRTLIVVGATNDRALRFFRESLGRAAVIPLAQQLGATYLAPTLWQARYVRRLAGRDVRREQWEVAVAPDGRVRVVSHLVADDAPGAAPTADSARALAAAAVRTRGYDPARLREAEFRQTARPHRLDTDVDYIDPAVILPGGATARVDVTLAGNEPVRVARDLRLPERWLLADQRRASTQGLIGGLAGLALVGLLFSLTIRGARTGRPLLPAAVGRRALVIIGAAVAALTLARAALRLPDRLADWDTTVPWANFVTTQVLNTVLGAVLAAALTVALWLLADSLRRRASVPILPTPDAGSAGHPVRDGVLLGLALGTALPALAGLGDFARTAAGIPNAPSTTLDVLLPWAGPTVALLGGLLNAPLAALPALAVVAGAHTARVRWLVLAAVTALTVVAAWAAADATLGGWTLALGAVVSVAIVAAVVWAFGRAVLPWFVAVPAGSLLAELRAARAAANGTDRVGALIGALIAAALIVATYRFATRMARTRSQPSTAAVPAAHAAA